MESERLTNENRTKDQEMNDGLDRRSEEFNLVGRRVDRIGELALSEGRDEDGA